MNDFVKKCEKRISEVQELLKQNPEWIKRYADYAQDISVNLEKIKSEKQKINEWAPLYLYMTVGQAKAQMVFSLRYLGQDVAKLKVGKGKITITTKGFDDINKRDFDCGVELDGNEWTSKESASFRRHFAGLPERAENSGKHNEEHRLESLLLTEFSKKSGENKILRNIQPVKFSGSARFQMCTPLSASSIEKVSYSGANGGGIDMLARVGRGVAKLCIMEVKKDNKKPTDAILQGLAYAAFIQELLRSESGGQWWKIFGYSGELPEPLELYVACVMPSIDNNDISFSKEMIKTNNRDSFHLHYIYFQEKNNNLVDVATSLNQYIVSS